MGAMKQPQTIMLTGLAMLAGVGLAGAEPGEGRGGTPAVVNPALRSEHRATLSLDGEWDFAVDPEGKGEAGGWFRPGVRLPEATTIRVPGCWEAQGVGGEGVSVSVTPEQRNRPLRGSYVGTAWYRKQVTVPAAWRGREIWLKFGGVHAQGWFWANGTFLGHDDCYCGTWKYRVTDLVGDDGKLVIAVKARNDVPSGKGLFGWIHRFGGLYRSVELEATPAVLVDYAHVEGDLDAKSAAVHVTLRSTAADAQQVEVEAALATLDGRKAGNVCREVTVEPGATREVVLTAALDPFHAWSPEHPDLYRADIVLKRGGEAVDGWVERFGVRKWEVRGGGFYLNNRKHFVRGFGDDWVYPLTICSPASREVHREHLGLARKFGFNYVRHHTHCEVPEFFDAADELGIMVQPELPYYGARPSAGTEGWFRPKEDLRELVTHYRRHVSLSTYCGGNEGHIGSPIDKGLYSLAKELDPTRLFLHQDGGHNTPENSDFGTGPAGIWKPETTHGYSSFRTDRKRAWFAHEYLNLTVQRDPRLAWKYTGAQLPPVPAEPFQRELEEAGLSIRWGNDLLDSGHYLHRLWQKLGLESARLDPACDGYIYWTMMDVGYHGDQGLLDQFWHVKKTTPRFFRRFNSPTAVLAASDQTPIGADQRIMAEGDTLRLDWWISHFDEAPLQDATLAWRVETDGRVLGRGRIEGIDAAVGDVRQVGTMSFAVANIGKPVKARLIGGLEGMAVENSWDLWLFPRLSPRKDAGKGLAASGNLYEALEPRYPGLSRAGRGDVGDAKVLVTSRLDPAAIKALGEGRSVLLVNLLGPVPGLAPGWWSMSGQAGTVIADHPAFGDFPHDGHLSHLFFRLLKNTVPCRDAQYRGAEKLMVTCGRDGYLAHVFQARAGKGRLLACGLDVLGQNPESVWLLDQFIRYARSPRFDPRGEYDLQGALDHLEALRSLNGWTETVTSKTRTQYGSFLGEMPMDVARFAHGEKEVAWLTQPVPEDLAADATHTFRWVAALGWISEAAAEFQLLLGDKPLLEFGVTHEPTTWKSADGAVTLQFTPKNAEGGGQDRSGIMELTLPARLLKPGKKATLRVLAPQTGSQRWFGLYHCP